MANSGLIKVLLVEDDEDDFIIARDVFSEIRSTQFSLDWVKTFEAGMQTMCRNLHDIVLVDYRLGAHNGVELLRAGLEGGCQAPVILLTGSGEHQVDVEAMQAGAADYIIKPQLQANSLERTIRYALQRQRAATLAAFEQARLAAFGADVGLALTRRDSLEAILDRCARAMVQFLNAAVVQISTFDAQRLAFEPRAAAGSLPAPAVSPGSIPALTLDAGQLVAGKPVLVKHLLEDPRLANHELIRGQGLVSGAVYPLMLEDKLVGCVSLFAQHQIPEQVCQELGSVAHGIALCIERKRSEAALGVSEVKYRSVVENIKEVIFQTDEFGNWTFLNPAWTAITGFEIKPTMGTFFLEYISEEDREHNRSIFLQLIERRLEYCRYETRFLTNNGKIRWVEFYSQLTLNHDGTVLGTSGSLIDITERKLAETAIQKLAAFL